MTHRRGVGVAAPGPRRIRYAVVPVAAALTAMVIGGCSPDDPTPSPTPTVVSSSATPSASSPSPSPSPTKSEPVKVEVPAAAKKQTPDGAVAFVKFYFDEVNRAWMTADPEILSRLSTKECLSCTSLIKTATELKRDGHRYDTAPIEVVSAESAGSAQQNLHLVLAAIRQTGAPVVDVNGAVVDRDSVKALSRSVQVKWGGNSWLLDGMAAG